MNAITPISDVFIKAVTAKIISHDRRSEVASTARNLFPNTKGVVEASINPADFVRRAVTNPAMTSVAGWGFELAGAKRNVDFLSTLAPRSSYARLAALGLKIDLTGSGLATIPSWSTVANGSFFVAEGQAISVRQSSLARASMEPRKGAIISVFTSQLADHSVPSIEAILRAGLESDAWAEVDTVLVGNGAASVSQPAGIRNGAATVTPTAGGGVAALGGDLGALAGAVAASGPVQTPVYLMNPADLGRAVALSPGIGNTDLMTVISSPYLPAKTVVFLDGSAFASASRDEPEIVISREPTLVTRSPDPAAIVNAAGVSGIPTLSTFQQDCYAIRIIIDLAWGIPATRVAAAAAVTW